ncbi:MAG: hypothetical protein ACE5FN_12350 [Leptospirillia bacterium]
MLPFLQLDHAAFDLDRGHTVTDRIHQLFLFTVDLHQLFLSRSDRGVLRHADLVLAAGILLREHFTQLRCHQMMLKA